MDKYCEKCGERNSTESRFCKNCGTEFKSPAIKVNSQKNDDRNKAIILALIGVIAVLAIGTLFAGGLFKSEVPLDRMNFGGITMMAPQGSDFVEFDSLGPYENIGGFIYFKNEGAYSEEVGMFGVSTAASIPSGVSHIKEDEGVQVFKDDTLDMYFVSKKEGDYYLSLIGNDYETMVEMLKSVRIIDESLLKSQSTQTPSTSQTTSSSAAPTSSTPSSISILGGSFSTGSADEDKTYARINVGTAHAGEEVIVQIFYSRDGNSLNNGNMVPATVHSDGYLEIASADAYAYFPDHATVKIYDKNSNLLTTKDVYLSPTSGTQTF